MKFDLEEAISILEKTPEVLSHLLHGLSDDWIFENEGGESWSPHEVIAHLVFGERTDWIPRVRLILNSPNSNRFTPFDMIGHKELMEKHGLNDLLIMFKNARSENLKSLKDLHIEDPQFELEGIHPEFGQVTLKNHLSAWVVHDLGHIAQITRVMAKQYALEVGPWTKYMGVLNDRTQA